MFLEKENKKNGTITQIRAVLKHLMTYLMVDISGRSPVCNNPLYEALHKTLLPEHHLKSLASNINAKNVDFDYYRLFNIFPLRLQESKKNVPGNKSTDGHRKLQHVLNSELQKSPKPMILIIDEWLLFKLRENEARLLLEVIHKRRKKSSTIFCSQYEEKDWYNQICDGESTLADAIMDRISFDSYR